VDVIPHADMQIVCSVDDLYLSSPSLLRTADWHRLLVLSAVIIVMRRSFEATSSSNRAFIASERGRRSGTRSYLVDRGRMPGCRFRANPPDTGPRPRRELACYQQSVPTFLTPDRRNATLPWAGSHVWEL
jgi:hypothetical protein